MRLILVFITISALWIVRAIDVDTEEPKPEPKPALRKDESSETAHESLPEMTVENLEADLEVISNVDDTLDKIEGNSDTELKSELAKRLPINFKDMSSEDYGNDEEDSKPDNVDNDAIQQLVDRFLNEGTLQEDANKKINKEVQALIGSTDYWKPVASETKDSIKNNEEAAKWIQGYNTEASKILKQVALAGWNYQTAVSVQSKKYLDEAEDGLRQFLHATSTQARQFDLNSVSDALTKRQIELISIEGVNALEDTEFQEYNQILSSINKVFTAVDICETSDQKTPCFTKYTDLSTIIAGTHDPQKLLNLWKSWRNTVGQNLTKNFERLIQLTNKAAEMNGFKNAGQMWLSPFDLSTRTTKQEIDLMAEVDKVYLQIEPFYKQLHAYLRREIAAIFKDQSSITRDGPIPIHLLKGEGGGDWSMYYEATKPFDAEDVIPEEIVMSLKQQNFTAKTMFTKAYRYFKFLGFGKLPKTLWNNSIFSRIWSKDMICNPATAYDMMNGEDYRIKACGQLKEPDFIQAHKLFAELYYKYLPRENPILLRDAPNPSFLQAIENAFGVIAANSDYMKSHMILGENAFRDEAIMVNKLYKEALSDLVKLPFDMVSDKWRFGAFGKQYDSSKWSAIWWKLREKIQGVSPPAETAMEFDPVSIPSIVQKQSPAMKHFVTYVLQFQILDALCMGDSTPLSEGCIPKKQNVQKIIEVMNKGAKINWVEALEEITGSRKLDATPLLLYFEPLHNWLLNANKKDNVFIGWDGKGEAFKPEELPEINLPTGDEGNFAFSEDNFAYPGGDCSSGRECLLESECNGTICVCRKGTYTFEVGGTYNCVPENPKDAGFGDGNNLVLELNPAETTTLTAITTKNPVTRSPNNNAQLNHFNLLFVVLIMLNYLF